MTTTETQIKKRETWRDWMPEGAPEPATMTRTELLDRLRAWRIDASERDLRYWEYEGVLPRSTRRGRHAAYPDWYPHLVRQVRHLQRLGFSLEQIKRRTRTFADYELGLRSGTGDPLDEEIRAHKYGVLMGPEDLRLPKALIEGAEQLARWHERIARVPTDHVQFWVVDAEGNMTLYPHPIGAPPRFVPQGPPTVRSIDPPPDDDTDTKN